MKNAILLICLSISAVLATRSSVMAQSGACPGYSAYHDPENGTITLSTTYPPYVSASPNANSMPGTGYCTSDQHFYSYNGCTAASSTSGTVYTYTISFPTATSVYGFLLYISGGYVDNAQWYSNGTSTNFAAPSGSVTYPFTGMISYSPLGGTVNYASQLVVQVRWTTAGATNSLQFYGYNNNYTLSAFSAITVNTSDFPTAPPAPAAIYLGSPVCSVPGWSIDPGSNAQSFNWGYNGGPNMGGQMGMYPNASYPYSDGPTIPNPYSSAVTVDLCVTAYSTGNSCAVAQASPSYCGSLSIPSGSTACNHGYGTPNSAGALVKGNAATLQSVSGNAVFPNPAVNFVHVNFDKAANHTVDLVSVTGKICKRIQNNEAGTLQIDVSELPRAVYFVIIYENKTVVARRAIVMQ